MLLLGAVLVGVPHGVEAATDSVSFTRVDIAMPAAPDSVAIGDLDGVHGKDIVVALPASSGVGVMLNNGDGTFAAMVPYTGGPQCAGLAVDITLGDVTQPTGNPLLPDGKLDAYVACWPYVVRLTGDGTGALTTPTPFNLGVQQYLGADTLDMLTLMRRPDSTPTTPPLLVFQHAVSSFGRQLCISYELDPALLVCNNTPVQGPLAVGDLNGTIAGVPPDEIVTSEGGALMGIFGFAPPVPPSTPMTWGDSTRNVPGNPPGVESAVMGDLDNDGDLDVLVGQYVNSLNDRVDSVHYFRWGATGLEQVAQTLPSTAGLDAVAVADIDGDGCNDVVGAGAFGRGIVHLGTGAGGFDNGRNLEQLGFGNPATATRVTMAVGDLTGDGRPEIVISDANAHAVMVYRNTSTTAGSACVDTPPTAVNDLAVVVEDAGATPIDVLANDTDPDSGPKSVVAVTQAAHGGVAIAGVGVTYQPSPDYCNSPGGVPDTFTYTLNGGSVATVTVTVQCVTDPPPPPPPPAPRTCTTPGTTAYTVGTPGADVLVGTIARDVLSGRAGDDCIFGLRGDDLLTGGTGADLFNASTGDDRMKGDAGADKFNGGNGNDDITPGAGQDLVNGQGGDDTILARDGERDVIDCGAGVDKVTADRSDVVKNCEYVKRPTRAA